MRWEDQKAENEPRAEHQEATVGEKRTTLAASGSVEFVSPDAPSPEQNQVRRIIDFSASTYKVLEELAKGRSIGDALRDAIALSKWFKDAREDGARILVERNGKLKEIITIKYPSGKY